MHSGVVRFPGDNVTSIAGNFPPLILTQISSALRKSLYRSADGRILTRKQPPRSALR